MFPNRIKNPTDGLQTADLTCQVESGYTLETDGLSVHDMGGQGYDKAADMPGRVCAPHVREQRLQCQRSG